MPHIIQTAVETHLLGPSIIQRAFINNYDSIVRAFLRERVELYLQIFLGITTFRALLGYISIW